MITIEGLIRAVLTRSFKEKTDEVTGEVIPARKENKVQIEYLEPQQEGDHKVVVGSFTLKDDHQVKACSAATGKIVRLPLALWVIDGKAGLYIPGHALPIVVK